MGHKFFNTYITMEQTRATGYDSQHTDALDIATRERLNKIIKDQNSTLSSDMPGFGPQLVENATSKFNIIGWDKVADSAVPDDQYEEMRAQNTTLGHWRFLDQRLLKGLGKLTGLTLAYTGGNLLGGAAGLIEGIADPKNFWSHMTENDVSLFFDETSDWINKGTEIYKTRAEREGNVAQRFFSSGFIFDDLMQGGAFMTSAIASSAIVGNALGAMPKLSKLGMSAAKGLQKAELLAKGSSALKKAAKVSQSLSAVPRTATHMYFTSGYEAGVEAKGFLEESRAKFIDEWMRQYGVAPSEADIVRHEKELQGVAAGIYAANAALVGWTNLKMGLLSTGNKIRPLVNANRFERTAEGAYKVADKSRAAKIWDSAAGRLVRGSFYEGVVEEGMQGVFRDTGKEFIARRYNLDGSIKDDFMDSLMPSIQKAFGDTYGLKNTDNVMEILAGVVLGAAGGAREARSYRRERNYREQTEEQIVQLLNSNKVEGVAGWVAKNGDVLRNTILALRAYNGDKAATAQLDAMVEAGDFKGAKDAEIQGLYNVIKSRVDSGHMQDAIDDITDWVNNNEDLAGESLEAVDRRLQIVDNFKQYAKIVENSTKKVASFFDPDFLSPERAVHDMLVFWDSTVDKNIVRRKQIAEETNRKILKASGIRALNDYARTNIPMVEDFIEAITNQDKARTDELALTLDSYEGMTQDVADELLQNIKDVVAIDAGIDYMIGEYNRVRYGIENGQLQEIIDEILEAKPVEQKLLPPAKSNIQQVAEDAQIVTEETPEVIEEVPGEVEEQEAKEVVEEQEEQEEQEEETPAKVDKPLVEGLIDETYTPEELRQAAQEDGNPDTAAMVEAAIEAAMQQMSKKELPDQPRNTKGLQLQGGSVASTIKLVNKAADRKTRNWSNAAINQIFNAYLQAVVNKLDFPKYVTGVNSIMPFITDYKFSIDEEYSTEQGASLADKSTWDNIGIHVHMSVNFGKDNVSGIKDKSLEHGIAKNVDFVLPSPNKEDLSPEEMSILRTNRTIVLEALSQGRQPKFTDVFLYHGEPNNQKKEGSNEAVLRSVADAKWSYVTDINTAKLSTVPGKNQLALGVFMKDLDGSWAIFSLYNKGGREGGRKRSIIGRLKDGEQSRGQLFLIPSPIFLGSSAWRGADGKIKNSSFPIRLNISRLSDIADKSFARTLATIMLTASNPVNDYSLSHGVQKMVESLFFIAKPGYKGKTQGLSYDVIDFDGSTRHVWRATKEGGDAITMDISKTPSEKNIEQLTEFLYNMHFTANINDASNSVATFIDIFNTGIKEAGMEESVSVESLFNDANIMESEKMPWVLYMIKRGWITTDLGDVPTINPFVNYTLEDPAVNNTTPAVDPAPEQIAPEKNIAEILPEDSLRTVVEKLGLEEVKGDLSQAYSGAETNRYINLSKKLLSALNRRKRASTRVFLVSSQDLERLQNAFPGFKKDWNAYSDTDSQGSIILLRTDKPIKDSSLPHELIHSTINDRIYTWDENGERVISEQGLTYKKRAEAIIARLEEVSNDTSSNEALRNNIKKLLPYLTDNNRSWTELFAYGFTDKTVAGILMSIESNEKTTRKPKTLWKQFVDLVKDIVGLNIKGRTLLDDVALVMDDIFNGVTPSEHFDVATKEDVAVKVEEISIQEAAPKKEMSIEEAFQYTRDPNRKAGENNELIDRLKSLGLAERNWFTGQYEKNIAAKNVNQEARSRIMMAITHRKQVESLAQSIIGASNVSEFNTKDTSSAVKTVLNRMEPLAALWENKASKYISLAANAKNSGNIDLAKEYARLASEAIEAFKKVNYVLDNFNNKFSRDVIDEIRDRGFLVRKKDVLEDESAVVSEEEDNEIDAGYNDGGHFVISNNKDYKESASAVLKSAINNCIEKLDINTGLPKYYEFNAKFYDIMLKFKDCVDMYDIVDKLNTLAKSDVDNKMPNGFYVQLRNQLIPTIDTSSTAEVKDASIKYMFSNLLKYATFVRASVINFESAIAYKDPVNNIPIISRTELSNFTKSRTLAARWNIAFTEDVGLYEVVQTNGANINLLRSERLWDIIKEYQDFIKKAGNKVSIAKEMDGDGQAVVLNELKSELCNTLKKVGIQATPESLSNLLEYSSDFENTLDGFYSYIASTGTGKGRGLSDFFIGTLVDIANGKQMKYKNGNPIKHTKIFESNDPVNELAAAWNLTYTSKELFSVEGPDGAKYYRMALTHNMSETIKRLKRGDEIEFLKNFKFHKDSYWLEHWTKNPEYLADLRLTFSLDYRNGINSITKFVNTAVELEETSDQIRILNEFYGFLDNKVPMPVPGDAKMFFNVAGVPIWDAVVSMDRVKDGEAYKNIIGLDSKTIDRFHKYFKTELELVKDAFAYRDNLISKGIDPNVDAGNIQHYYFNKKGKEGSGLRFRKFNLLINISGRNIPANELLDKAESIGGEDVVKIRSHIFNYLENEANAKQSIEDAILNEVDEHYQKLIDTKIITYNSTSRNKRPKFNRTGMANTSMTANFSSAALSKFKKLISVNPDLGIDNSAARYSLVANYAINHMIAMIEFEKVFSEDIAFYGSYDASTKRMSQWRTTFNALAGKVDPALFSDNKDIQDFIVRNGLDTESFEEVQLNDSKTSMANYKAFGDAIKNSFEKYITALDSSISKEERAAIAEDRKMAIAEYFGLDKINWADGAAYASPALMKRILLDRGIELHRIEAAFEFFMDPNLDINKPMTKEQADRFAEFADMFLGPQKMAYVGKDAVGHDGLLAPNINKMAIFPLFPCFVKNMPMEKVLQMAYSEETGKYDKAILFTTNSAKKVGFAVGNATDIMNPNQDVQRYTRLYRQLGHQLNTDPHDSTKAKLGIQLKKLIATGLLDDEMYGKYYGWQVRESLELTIRELSKKGNEKFFSMIGAKIDSEGNLEIKLSDMVAYLKSIAGDSISHQTKEMLTTVDNKLALELSFMGGINKLQAQYLSAMSRYNIDVNLQGGNYIQMSSAGLSVTGRFDKKNRTFLSEKELRIRAIRSKIDNNENILKNPTEEYLPYLDIIPERIKQMQEEIKYLESIENVLDLRINHKGKFNYGECMVSINLFKHLVPNVFKDENGNIIYHQQASDWLLRYINDMDDKGDVSRKHLILSWRVPTQALSSVRALSIVGFLPSFMGDTIVVPDAWTALNGSDFDIDKLFLVRPEYDLKTTDEDGKQVNSLHKVEFDDSKANGNIPSMDIARLAGEIQSKTGMGIENAHIRAEYRLREIYNLEHNGERECKNHLLDMMINSVSANEQMHATMQPLDAVKEILEEVVDEYGIRRDPSIRKGLGSVAADLSLATRKLYTAGKDGVAPHANQSNITSLAQVAGLRFFDSNIMSKLGLQRLDRQISFAQRQILDFTNLLISGHVDFATDPVLAKLNINSDTYNLLALATLTGIGHIGIRFVGSPALFDYASAIEGNANNLFTKDNTSPWLLNKLSKEGVYAMYDSKAAELAKANRFDGRQSVMYNLLTLLEENRKNRVVNNTEVREAFVELAKHYFSPNADMNRFGINYRLWNDYDRTIDDEGMFKEDHYPQFILDQMMIMKIVDELESPSRSLSKLIPLAQVDAKKFGYTLNQLHAWDAKLEEFVKSDKNIEGLQDFFDNLYISTNKELAIDGAQDVWNEMMWENSNGVIGTNRKIFKLLGNTTYDDKLFNKVTMALRSAVLSESVIEFINKEGVMSNGDSIMQSFGANNIGDVYHNMFYGKYSTAAKLKAVRDHVANLSNSSDYILLEHLDAVFPYIVTAYGDNIVSRQGKESDPQLVLAPDFSEDSESTLSDLRDSWSIMMNDNTEVLISRPSDSAQVTTTVKDLAIELALYSILTSGMSTSYRSFNNLLPAQFYIDSGLNDALHDEHMSAKTTPASVAHYNDMIDKVIQGMASTKGLLINAQYSVPKFSASSGSNIDMYGNMEDRAGTRFHQNLSVNEYSKSGRAFTEIVKNNSDVVPPALIRFEHLSGYKYGKKFYYNPAREFTVGYTGIDNNINVWAKYINVPVSDGTGRDANERVFLYRCVGTYSYIVDDKVYQDPIYMLSQQYGWASSADSVSSGIKINEIHMGVIDEDGSVSDSSMFSENNIINTYKNVLGSDLSYIPEGNIGLAKDLFGQEAYSQFYNEDGTLKPGITFNAEAVYAGEFNQAERDDVLFPGETVFRQEVESKLTGNAETEIDWIANGFEHRSNAVSASSLSQTEKNAHKTATAQMMELAKERSKNLSNSLKDISDDYKSAEYNVASRHNTSVLQDIAFKVSSDAKKRLNVITGFDGLSISVYDKDRTGVNIGDVYVNLRKLTENRIKNSPSIAIAMSMANSSNSRIRKIYNDMRIIMSSSSDYFNAVRKYSNDSYTLSTNNILDIVVGNAIATDHEFIKDLSSKLLEMMGIELNIDMRSLFNDLRSDKYSDYHTFQDAEKSIEFAIDAVSNIRLTGNFEVDFSKLEDIINKTDAKYAADKLSGLHSIIDPDTGKTMISVGKGKALLGYSPDMEAMTTDNAEILAKSQARGILFHGIIEKIIKKQAITDADKKIEHFVKKGGKKIEMSISDAAIDSIRSEWNVLKASLGLSTDLIILTEKTIADKDANIAGVADLIIIDKSTGKRFVLDHKTSNNMFKGYEAARSVDSFYSTRDGNNFQSAAYVSILNNMGLAFEHGEDVRGIIMWNMSINSNGEIINVSLNRYTRPAVLTKDRFGYIGMDVFTDTQTEAIERFRELVKGKDIAEVEAEIAELKKSRSGKRSITKDAELDLRVRLKKLRATKSNSPIVQRSIREAESRLNRLIGQLKEDDLRLSMEALVSSIKRDVEVATNYLNNSPTGLDARLVSANMLAKLEEMIAAYQPIVENMSSMFNNKDMFNEFTRLFYPGDAASALEFKDELKNIVGGFHDIVGSIKRATLESAQGAVYETFKQKGIEHLYEQSNIKYTETTDDTNAIFKLLTPAKASGDILIRVVGEMMRRAQELSHIKTYERLMPAASLYEKAVKAVGKNANKYLLDIDTNGAKTGYLLMDLMWGEFYKDEAELREQLRIKFGISSKSEIINDPTLRSAYEEEMNNWLNDQLERKFTKEFYAIYNKMSDLAKTRRAIVNDEIAEIRMNKAFIDESTGLLDYSKMMKSVVNKKTGLTAYDQYVDLLNAKKNLANIFDENGLRKAGPELEVAMEIAEFNKAFAELIGKSNETTNKALFETANQSAKAKWGEDSAEYQEWYINNTAKEIDPKFWEDLDELSNERLRNDPEVKRIKEERNAILDLVKNPLTGKTDYRILAKYNNRANDGSNYIVELINNLDSQYNLATKKYKGTGSSFEDFKGVVTFTVSPVFMQLHKEMTAKANAVIDKNDPGSKKKAADRAKAITWLSQNKFTKGKSGKTEASSLWMDINPNKKYISIRPSNEFSEFDPNSTIINKEYQRRIDAGETGIRLLKRDKYGIELPKFAEQKARWDAIQNNPELKAYYEAIKSMLTDAHEMAGVTSRDSAVMLGQVRKNNLERLNLSAQGIKDMTRDFINGIMDRVDDTDFNTTHWNVGDGRSVYTIPLRYVSKLENPEELSEDVLWSTGLVYRSATQYVEFNNVAADIENLHRVMGRRQYMPGKGKESKEGQATNYYDQLTSLMEMNMYGKPKSTQTWEVAGYNVNLSKAGDHLVSYFRDINLMYNSYTILANAASGKLNSLVEAMSGQYITRKDIAFADRQFMLHSDVKQTGGLVQNNYIRSLTRSIGLVSDTGEMSRNGNRGKFARTWAQSSSYAATPFSYAGYEVGDFYFKTCGLIAIMHAMKPTQFGWLTKHQFLEAYANSMVDGIGKKFTSRNGRYEFEERADGFYRNDKKITESQFHNAALNYFEKEAGEQYDAISQNAYDAFTHDEHGVLVIKPEYQDLIPDKNELLLKITGIAKHFAGLVDGMLSGVDRVAASQSFLGRMFIMHRSPIINIAMHRFKQRGVNMATGQMEEGAFRTIFGAKDADGNHDSFLSNMWQNIKETKNIIEASRLTWSTMNRMQKDNVKRIGAELLMLTLTFGLLMLAGAFWPDDEYESLKDKPWAVNYMTYMIMRIRWEQLTWFNPAEINAMLKAPFAANATIDRIFHFWEAFFLFATSQSGKYEGWNVATKWWLNMTPFRHFREMLHPESKIQWMNSK